MLFVFRMQWAAGGRNSLSTLDSQDSCWYVYFIGGILHTVFAGVMFAESTWPILVWICAMSAPLGFYYAWGAWKQDTRNRDDA